MIGRLLAICGWLALQVGRPFRASPLRRFGRGPVVAVAVLLLVLAAAPIVVPLFDAQPQDVLVQEVMDGAIDGPSAWVRLRGRITPLEESPTGAPGSFALLVDSDNPLRAIVVTRPTKFEPAASTVVTGHLVPATVEVTEELPIEATVAGTPPRVVADQMLTADPIAKPERPSLWPLAVIPTLLALALFIGARMGYPLFRPSSEVDVLVTPLAPGERLPAAWGGRVGPSVRDLADPGGALLLVQRGPKGNLLTAQPLADDGGVAPKPVPIGGGWTRGRIGYVHTVSETVPALVVRSELVDATFLFARTTERDRAAAHVSVDR